jgi:hypothetical protein
MTKPYFRNQINLKMVQIRYALVLLALALSFLSFGRSDMFETEPLSQKSYVSLYTCDPGEELYATFGHTAIGVIDPEQNLLVVFNYGTFDFNVPNFYLKFARGKLLYKLSAGNYYRFLVEYEVQDRQVTEQRLNLTLGQRQRLLDLLMENYKPENRFYQYDFFFDNCSNRILEMLYLTLGDSLVYQPGSEEGRLTYRNLIYPYLGRSPWSKFGIDLALGAVIDRAATPREKAFLPDLLMEYCNHSKINGQPFVTATNILVKPTPLPKGTPFWASPLFVFWILFGVVVAFSFINRKKYWMIADRIIFSTFGLIGIIILLLWFATDHDATANNLNILWANPLYLFYCFAPGTSKEDYLKWFKRILIGFNLIVLLGWFWLPQQFNSCIIPLIGIAMIRLLSGLEIKWNRSALAH